MAGFFAGASGLVGLVCLVVLALTSGFSLAATVAVVGFALIAAWPALRQPYRPAGLDAATAMPPKARVAGRARIAATAGGLALVVAAACLVLALVGRAFLDDEFLAYLAGATFLGFGIGELAVAIRVVRWERANGQMLFQEAPTWRPAKGPFYIDTASRGQRAPARDARPA